MTIALSIKINDGVVLASDSASTVTDTTGGVLNIYDNANKIFNLKKGLPIGSIFWGLGNIGNASLETITKDFRKNYDVKAKYTIKKVAEDYSTHIKNLYDEAFKDIPEENKPGLGFLVVGYAEEYLTTISHGKQTGPKEIRKEDETGLFWEGETDPISRLIFGVSNVLPETLKTELKITDEQITPLLSKIRQKSEIGLIHPSMPVQDAIQLAAFLVDFAIKFSHFKMGAPTVGGPIEIAAITKYESFKWIKRKHYFSQEFNLSI